MATTDNSGPTQVAGTEATRLALGPQRYPACIRPTRPHRCTILRWDSAQSCRAVPCGGLAQRSSGWGELPSHAGSSTPPAALRKHCAGVLPLHQRRVLWRLQRWHARGVPTSCLPGTCTFVQHMGAQHTRIRLSHSCDRTSLCRRLLHRRRTTPLLTRHHPCSRWQSPKRCSAPPPSRTRST
jgi:hypothetical protein